jgi:hypothetical protein
MTKVSRRINKLKCSERKERNKSVRMRPQSTSHAGLTDYELYNPCGKAGMPEADYERMVAGWPPYLRFSEAILSDIARLYATNLGFTRQAERPPAPRRNYGRTH